VFSARVPLLLAAVSAWGPAARQAAAAARGPTPLAASRAMGVARQNHGDVLDLVRAAHVVCFDVDSTLLTVEGIDELADVAGVHDQVQNLTSAAMDGAMTFHASLGKRLDIIKPNRDLLQKTLRLRPPCEHLSPNVRELVALLHSRDVAVYLISGGFKEMIEPVARQLGIQADRVYANSLRWDHHGEFLSFDPQSFTAVEGGKRRAIQHIRQLHAPGGCGAGSLVVVHIGDGATDAEARDDGSGAGGADLFIGFGGSKERANVREAADWYIRDFQEIVDVLT